MVWLSLCLLFFGDIDLQIMIHPLQASLTDKKRVPEELRAAVVRPQAIKYILIVQINNHPYNHPDQSD